MKKFALVAVIVTGSLLLYAVGDFPAFGDAKSPANAGVEGGFSVSRYYITETAADTAVPNIVTAVLADYRGYDTFFETTVIFIAGLAIFAILRVANPGAPDRRDRPSSDSGVEGDHNRVIIGMTCRLLIPVIQLFALYVVAHGHHSPGGGFQGGVMLGASFILIAIASDLDTALRRFSERRYLALGCVGILIYGGFGLLCQLLDRHFLDYGVLHKLMGVTPVMARSHSMLGVEIGVAFTVTSVMFAIYANLSTRGELRSGL
ncbi:MAG: hypothetical protein KDM91_02375 [Verrucomicrobiae bacterium]|nr:hypothetical protein [Verrucomicrobiae bacterium]MCP5539213.1 hypothetical protein [Akkermansiaceae bacterium]MCP5549866.1 hypothetical protein [Akkermansiaceae bacterium]